MMKNRILWGFFTAALLAAVVTFLLWRGTASPAEEEVVPADSVSVAMPVLKYGLPIEQYNVRYDTLRPRQTLAEVLFSFGFTAQQIHTLVQCPDSIFDARRLRPGQACALLCAKDSAATPRYFVYEESVKECFG